VRLSWSPVGEADRYRVRMVTSSLAAVFEVEDLADTVVIVPGKALRPSQDVLGPGAGSSAQTSAALFFQVVALRGTRELRRSELIEIGAR